MRNALTPRNQDEATMTSITANRAHAGTKGRTIEGRALRPRCQESTAFLSAEPFPNRAEHNGWKGTIDKDLPVEVE